MAGVHGFVTVSTCNRFEIYIDADSDALDFLSDIPSQYRALWPSTAEFYRGTAAAQHLFAVASGLDSLVVGEREIVGQIRRALSTARENGTATANLERLFQRALHTSRQVATRTELARSGRSVVSIALDLLDRALLRQHGEPDQLAKFTAATIPASTPAPASTRAENWRGRRVIVAGTGSYARVTVAALRERGCQDIAVWSASNRAADFAAKHGLQALEKRDFTDADAIIFCRGRGGHVFGPTDAAQIVAARGEANLIDLTISRDVDPAVRDVKGTYLIDLETISRHTPAVQREALTRAKELVETGLEDYVADMRGRDIDPVIVSLREKVAGTVERELQKIPRTAWLSAEDTNYYLRRLANSILHQPMQAAHRAARAGRAAEYHRAAELVFGAGFPPPRKSETVSPAPTTAPTSNTPRETDGLNG
ncbi:hypothetical protein ACU20_05180 [Actinobaculum suis]|nr:hypothetical protein ACU20_05180 [Actinobaculum suis]